MPTNWISGTQTSEPPDVRTTWTSGTGRFVPGAEAAIQSPRIATPKPNLSLASPLDAYSSVSADGLLPQLGASAFSLRFGAPRDKGWVGLCAAIEARVKWQTQSINTSSNKRSKTLIKCIIQSSRRVFLLVVPEKYVQESRAQRYRVKHVDSHLEHPPKFK